MMTVDRVIKRGPIAKRDVDTPSKNETVEDMCMNDPLYELIIGNVP